MFPENDCLEKVFWGLMNYTGDRWYAMVIFALLFIWAWYLRKEFHWRTKHYYVNSPKEAHLLNLQCRRWEKYVHQVMVGIGLSIGIAFVVYLLVEMGKDIVAIEIAASEDAAIPRGINLAYAEALLFVFIFSIKFRALWDAKGVHNDLKECDL